MCEAGQQHDAHADNRREYRYSEPSHWIDIRLIRMLSVPPPAPQMTSFERNQECGRWCAFRHGPFLANDTFHGPPRPSSLLQCGIGSTAARLAKLHPDRAMISSLRPSEKCCVLKR